MNYLEKVMRKLNGFGVKLGIQTVRKQDVEIVEEDNICFVKMIEMNNNNVIGYVTIDFERIVRYSDNEINKYLNEKLFACVRNFLYNFEEFPITKYE